MTSDANITTESKPSHDPASAVEQPPSRRRGLLKRLRQTRIFTRKMVRRLIRWGVYSLPMWIALAYLLWREVHTSGWQATYFSRVAAAATFSLAEGPSPDPWFPSFGPADERLGYTRVPALLDNLTKNGFVVAQQTRLSPKFLELARSGVYPPFHEKTQAGLTILDYNNTTIYSAYRPERVYESFSAVPKIVIDSLLFIENREILDQHYVTKNPAVEWDRLGKAIIEKTKQIFLPDLNAPGGSTIATQLEKYRHSREGRTNGARDKLLQMLSASYRAYLYGRETLETRKQIVLQYINSIPLAALRGYGEVNGLGDGLWAWYGLSFEQLNSTLHTISQLPPTADFTPYAEPFKQMLSLFIAHRRPSFYLLAGLDELNNLTDTYAELLARNGVIPEQLRAAAKGVKLTLRQAAPDTEPISFVQRKAANAIRTRLLQLLNYPQLYDLDQVDLTVKSTMENEANEAVTEVLRQIKDTESVKRFGLSGARNLSKGDPSKVIYSLTLFERVGNANVLRIQTDNFDNPFSINEGTRLDLGSTAKLRTLTTYLDVVAEIFQRFASRPTTELKSELGKNPDPITRFVLHELISTPKLSLDTLLDRAMQRKYSANPGESFFTGGGMHTFENFKKEDNGRIPTLLEAITHSINLPFIRLMRDLSRYYIYQLGISASSNTPARKDGVRMHYLRKFADQEGSHFQRQFYGKYRAKQPSELLTTLVKTTRASARHAAVMFRYVRPNDSVDKLSEFLRTTLPNANISYELVERWYREFGPGKFNLNDQGYLARIHPLELWLVKFLQDNHGAGIDRALEASRDQRQEVYEWLFKTPHRRAQDSRIRSLIEVESFLQIHKQWRKVGYPFNSMVPSLASAIGSSGDRPVALAELVGIILNDGVRYPAVRIDQLHFAAATPYETVLRRRDPDAGERVLPVEVARTLKRAMAAVVENGTARRVHHTYVRSDRRPYVIGGKTGTGDHRHETYGPGGHLISSRVVNRTATFAFFIGDRFFGVISAHVPGAEAAKFDFTSALAAELLKCLSPAVVPLIERSGSALSPFNPDTSSPVLNRVPPSAGVSAAAPGLTPVASKTPRAQGAQTTAHSQAAPAKSTPTPLATPRKETPTPKSAQKARAAQASPSKAVAEQDPLVLAPPA